MTDLVADIGGTNSRFALAENGQLLGDSIWKCLNTDYARFEDALETYLRGRPQPRRTCIAAAGPVQSGTVTLTNHSWTVTAEALPSAQATLLNDLQALGHALSPLGTPDTPKMVLNIGTGLNAAVLHSHAGAPFVAPAEAGHVRLPHLSDTAEAQMVDACAKAYGSNAMEAVLSGAGLTRLHHALTGKTLTGREITANWPPKTLALALKLLGHYLGDLALCHLPYGGIWLTGSLGVELEKKFPHPAFNESFSERGPYKYLMKGFKIHALTDTNAPLKGAALYLRR